jgi:serine protease Do
MFRFDGARVTIPALFLVATVFTSGSPVAAQESRPQAWLGVLLERAAPPSGSDDATLPQGAVLKRIIEESPAAEAGLRARDRIVHVDGAPVNSSAELISMIREMAPDSWVSLSFVRGGRERNASARLVARPPSMRGLRLRDGWIGVEAIDLPAGLREHFGAPAEAGVMVSHVEPGGPAEAAGFSLGDVVYEIDGEPVTSAGELGSLIQGGGVGNDLEITLARYGAEITLEATVSLRPDSP